MSPVDSCCVHALVRTIARYRVTVSLRPIAYDLCVRKVRPKSVRAGLELLAGGGRRRAAARRNDRALRSRLRPSAFGASSPGHVMAWRGDVAVTWQRTLCGATWPTSMDRRSSGGARGSDRRKASVQLVSSGQAASDCVSSSWTPIRCRMRSGRVVKSGSGPSVATGYFAAQEETMLVFDAQLEKERYLRTGDLGFLDGTNYSSRSYKDVIIGRGCNTISGYETTVMECIARCSGCGAAFA